MASCAGQLSFVGDSASACPQLPREGRQGMDQGQRSLIPTINCCPHRHGSMRAGLQEDSRKEVEMLKGGYRLALSLVSGGPHISPGSVPWGLTGSQLLEASKTKELGRGRLLQPISFSDPDTGTAGPAAAWNLSCAHSQAGCGSRDLPRSGCYSAGC